jgi:hypothetical protein
MFELAGMELAVGADGEKQAERSVLKFAPLALLFEILPSPALLRPSPAASLLG